MKIKGVFLTAILTAVLCISSNVLAYTGSGDGSAKNPYEIAYIVDLLELRADTDNYDKCFILTADIDLAGWSFVQAVISPDMDNEEWNGFQGTAFTGVFDGNGKTISNLTITGDTDPDYAGLFGYVDFSSGGQIKNLGVVNANIQGREYVGGLVGHINQGSITSCYVTGAVSGNDNVGGLVGCTYDSIISGCFATGTVNGYGLVGGLAGENYFGIITSCYATGSVTGTDVYAGVGGLVGRNEGSITSCYATGSVIGIGDYVGGLVGINTETGDVIYCYSTGAVSGNDYGGGLVGANFYAVNFSFWDTDTSGQLYSDGGEGKSTVDMKTLLTFTDAYWDFVTTDGDPADWRMPSNDYPRLAWEPVAWYSGGDGSTGNPYKIANVADFQKLSASPTHWGKYFIQTADIDMQGIEITPVGNYDNNFIGSYDGQSHIISNVYIYMPGSNIGIFGYVGSSGQISNLGVEDVNIVGSNEVGGLVGMNDGILTACYTTGSVSGTYNVGGLVGSNTNGTITSCYATGVVSGTSNSVGGLVGKNYSGTLTGCYATGPVSGTGDYVGGLAGENYFGIITSCYATGAISGTGGLFGGLVGANYASTLTECYATGPVSGTVSVGGLVGGNSSGSIESCFATGTVNGSGFLGGLVGVNGYASITNCYATGTVSGTDNYVGGLIGKNNQGQIQRCYSIGRPTGNTFVGGFCGGIVTGGSYEDTGNFWDNQTSGKTTSAMGTGKTTVEMKTLTTFTLAPASWDFVNETMNGIEDFWIMPDQSYPHLRWYKYSGGSGTAADPYRIANKSDLLAMTADTGNYDKYFILTADIDLAGESFTKAVIAPDTDNTQWTNFDGTTFTGFFDGNGKKISHLTITGLDQDYVGLFGCSYGGQIKNLGLANANIQGRRDVGGLVGENDSGTLTGCYATGSVTGTYDIGGLVGSNYYGTITSCYATASVTGTYRYIGGLVGYINSGTQTSCFATGAVSGPGGTSYVGGLVGFGGGSDTSCFWDKETSHQYYSWGGIGKTTAEMKTLSTFTDAGWDFSATDGDPADWIMPANSYPQLAWQSIPGDIAGLYGVNYVDFAVFAAHWEQTGCPDGCENADINNSGTVDITDLMSLAENWLAGI